MRRTLILFVRVPRLGVGKRRLARDIGNLAAVRFERLMLERCLRRLSRDRRWRLRLAVTPDRRGGGFRVPPYRMEVVPQGRGDLGARMRRALGGCPPGAKVLVGSDIPAMIAANIAEAFALLGRHDIVFGPARDGGFWLVGCRHRPPQFARVRWSTGHALADALGNVPPGRSVGFAASLDDVDDGDGYRRFMAAAWRPSPAPGPGDAATAGYCG
jgi:uncharacterized protein